MPISKQQKPPSSREISINPDQAGQRVDNFLINILKKVPRSHVYQLLRSGQARVNKGRKKPSYRLQTHDIVRIPPVWQAESSFSSPVNVSHAVLDRLRQAVIYEDSDLIIINKPTGMAVHGGSGLSFGVIEGLRQLWPSQHYLELVHRLDRETSGCLMIAKKRSVLRVLHEHLRGNGVDKQYVALVSGRATKDKIVVDQPLKKNVLRSGERIVRVAEEGKPSKTSFRMIERFKNATFYNIKPHTGRTHQIRVHAEHLGQPIAGDPKYGDDAFNEEMKLLGLNRLFLHAKSLSFTLPGWQQPLYIEAKMEDKLCKLLSRLRYDTTSGREQI